MQWLETSDLEEKMVVLQVGAELEEVGRLCFP